MEVGVKEGIYILIIEMEEGFEKFELWLVLGVKVNIRLFYCFYMIGKLLGIYVRFVNMLFKY